MTTAEESGASLLDAITEKDAVKSYACLLKFKESMRDPVIGADHVKWISAPVNITKVHAELTRCLGVPGRSMSVKRALMSRAQRAVMLVQAMEIAVKRVHHL